MLPVTGVVHTGSGGGGVALVVAHPRPGPIPPQIRRRFRIVVVVPRLSHGAARGDTAPSRVAIARELETSVLDAGEAQQLATDAVDPPTIVPTQLDQPFCHRRSALPQRLGTRFPTGLQCTGIAPTGISPCPAHGINRHGQCESRRRCHPRLGDAERVPVRILLQPAQLAVLCPQKGQQNPRSCCRLHCRSSQ